MPWKAITATIAEATGNTGAPDQTIPVSGGGINAAYRLEIGATAYFVKLNQADRQEMFSAEAEGLEALRVSGGPRLPAVVATGIAAGRCFLVLEWINLQGRGDWSGLGAQLATLHQTQARQHGWHRNNTIGVTPQINTPDDDWARFFGEHRLGYQLALARRNGAAAPLLDQGARLKSALPALFSGYRPVPSLLHGDLWSGNVAFDDSGQGVVYDPATYYGDRECDLAMTELFGRFPDAFYSAYSEAWPIDPGYSTRRDLYQLYHVLNHFNLFGGGYQASALDLISRLLAEAG